MPRLHATLRPCLVLLLLACVLPASSCGGSGGNGPPPLVNIAFPPGGSFTEATSIRVRGTSAGTALSGVTVGGVAAASADGFLTWSATVPLVTGDNAIPVVATKAAGGTDPSAPTLHVTRGVRMSPPASLDFDAGGNRLLVLDASVRRLTLLDLATGAHTLLSGSGRGTGTAFSRPEAAIFDLFRGRALVTDSDLNAVFAVDLANGNRTFLTGQGAGSGTALTEPQGMTLDPVGNRVFLVDSGIDALVSVNLTTGARLVLSNSTTGTGTNFSLPTEVQHDVAGNRVFVRDPSVGALFAVALATGNRSLVVDDTTGGFFDQSGGMALDLANNRMLATDAGFDRFFATDLTTGVHTILSNGPGDGPALDSPRTLVRDAANGRVLVGQGRHERILAIRLSDGVRSVAFDQRLGSGTRFDSPDAVGLELGQNRVLVADEVVRIGSELGALLDVDYRTAERTTFLVGPQPGGGFSRPTELRLDLVRGRGYVYSSTGGSLSRVDLDDRDLVVLADGSVGSGESLQFASDLCYDAPAARFLLTIGGTVNGVLAVDEATGNRTIFANAAVGTGVSTFGAVAIECDPSGAFVYYGTNSAGTIARINVATGVRSVLTSDPGVGPSVAGMSALRLDAANNRLLAFASLNDSIIAVNLATGSRTELSGPNVGQGVPVTGLSGGDVDLERQVAVFADVTMEWLVVVDLTNGDRVGFSR